MKISKITEFKSIISEHKQQREAAKAPSGLKFAIFDSINFVAKQAWQQVIPGEKLLMHHEYLSAVESSSGEGHEHRYVLFYHNLQPVAAAIFNLITIAGEDYGSSRDDNESKRNKLLKPVFRHIKDQRVDPALAF